MVQTYELGEYYVIKLTVKIKIIYNNDNTNKLVGIPSRNEKGK